MDALKALFSDFDLAAFLPDLDHFMGWVELGLRISVMAGPLLILFFGLLYLISPPKEANHFLGFRFHWGMASLDAWQFTQHWAGLIWSGLGVLLTIVMALICNGFRRVDAMTMAWTAVGCLIAELILIGGSCIAVFVIVWRTFDRDGFRRNEEME